MTISSGEIKRNMSILFEGEVYTIMEWQHRQAPKAPPTLTLRLRNVKTGNVFERKVPGNQKLTAAPMDRRNSQYLYSEGDLYTFMDNETYEQFPIGIDTLGDALNYVKEGESLDVLFYDGSVIQVEPPITVTLEVVETDAAIAGNTATGATKQAKLETGISVTVPLFVNAGDMLKVDTRTGEYLERASR
ncbi:MAG: elongation factor P [Chloroflexi bacterium]|nr:elongation factor P [Chloroflexota bacterium]